MSQAARLTFTVTASAATFSPSTPTKDAPPVACALRHSRATWPSLICCSVSFSVFTATAKSTSLSTKPSALACPPLTPANASTPLPPISSCCTATGSADSSSSGVPVRSASLTVDSRFSIANPPLTWKKPARSIVRLPDARVSSPRLPSIPSVTLTGSALVPADTARFFAAKSTRLPSPSSARLISTEIVSAAIVMSSSPTTDTSSAVACSAIQLRGAWFALTCSGVSFSPSIARPKVTPPRLRPVALSTSLPSSS